MECRYACQSPEHLLGRRSFLQLAAGGAGALAGATGLAPLWQPAVAAEVKRTDKRILVFWLAGGLSQLESWDPKPGTDTGGPFRTIPTSVPGTHICELLPLTAQQMHRLAIVRSVNTKNGDHGRGQLQMTTGRQPTIDYPRLGAVAAKLLAPEDSPLPGHIQITKKAGGGGSSGDAAYLGPRYAGMQLVDGALPSNVKRLDAVSADADQRRNALRGRLSDRFSQRRRTAETDAYTHTYEQAEQLMARQDVFDVSREPAQDQERYGQHDFGRHCLQARRLLEHGVPFVQVTHSNYDTHFENFDFHIEQLGEFDRPFATLVDDLAQRGMLESTLIVVMSEFGRTPKINANYGRDHWGTAWSVLLGGCGIQPGAVIGKTNDDGTAVTDREVDHGHLFHTYLRAVGVDTSGDFDLGGRKFPIADPAKGPIKELLV